MTIEEAIRYVESTWVSGAAPTILSAEVRRLRESEKHYHEQGRCQCGDGDGCYHVRSEDRYRGALERIAAQNLCSCRIHCQGIAQQALRGGEE